MCFWRIAFLHDSVTIQNHSAVVGFDLLYDNIAIENRKSHGIEVKKLVAATLPVESSSSTLLFNDLQQVSK
jgi:hypothetical protein